MGNTGALSPDVTVKIIFSLCEVTWRDHMAEFEPVCAVFDHLNESLIYDK